MPKLYQTLETPLRVYLWWRRIGPDPFPVLACQAALVKRRVITMSDRQGVSIVPVPAKMDSRAADYVDSVPFLALRGDKVSLA